MTGESERLQSAELQETADVSLDRDSCHLISSGTCCKCCPASWCEPPELDAILQFVFWYSTGPGCANYA